MAADLDKPEVFSELAQKLADQDKDWNARANHIFYLGLPPPMIDPVARELARPGSTRTASDPASWWKSPSATTWIRPGP